MNLLILEDEVPAYKKLVHHLAHYFEGNCEHQSVKSVAEGIDLLSQPHTFDLILSDVKLLDGTSFEIFNTVSVAVPIIFCTAFDEHLLEAFKTNGIAYILKPYSQQEIDDALKKYQDLFQQKPTENKLFDDFKTLLKQGDKTYKKRFAIKKNTGIKLLPTSQISCIEAYGDLCKLIDEQGNLHIVSSNLGTLAIDLDPSQFFRINRSHIVHIKYIKKIESYSKNRLSLIMAGLKKPIVTSSSTTKDFRRWLEH